MLPQGENEISLPYLELLRYRCHHRWRRPCTFLTARIYRRSLVVVSLTGNHCAVGIGGICVHTWIDFGIRPGGAGAAVNVVASHVAAGIPREIDAICGCGSSPA